MSHASYAIRIRTLGVAIAACLLTPLAMAQDIKVGLVAALTGQSAQSGEATVETTTLSGLYRASNRRSGS